MDIERLFPEYDWFHSDSVRESLSRILFVYAREHPAISYRQGMHELLAPLFFVLDCDKLVASPGGGGGGGGGGGHIVFELLSPSYIESDSYSLFSMLMDTTADWFVVRAMILPATISFYELISIFILSIIISSIY